MTVEQLIAKSLFASKSNGVYSRYQISAEDSPMAQEDVCGCWLLVFDSELLKSSWQEIYQELKDVILQHEACSQAISFEPVLEIDAVSLGINCGFNEAYTTDSYLEYLEYGSCVPNEWIVRDLGILHNAIIDLPHIPYDAGARRVLVGELIHRCFVKPHDELKWVEPWRLYLPPITLKDIETWNRKDVDVAD